MNSPFVYRLLADAILILHLFFVIFVVFGFVLILMGMRANWTWINNRLFRVSHLAAIAIVVAQAWLGRDCPLTVWENQFRVMAGQSGYSQTFVEYWLQKILFYQAESWVFTVIYTTFGIVVAGCWVMTLRGGKEE